ncbi:hypothetical protein [Sphingopyxis fribergensis]
MNNLKKISIGAVAALALLPAAVLAGTYSPSGTGNGGPSPVQVKKGITLSCTLTATTSSNGTISSTGVPSGTKITGISLTGGLCGAVSFSGFPYDITTLNATDIVINDVRVVGITGNCRGNLRAKLVGGVLQFVHTNTIPSDPPGGTPCSMQGNVATSPSASYTYP